MYLCVKSIVQIDSQIHRGKSFFKFTVLYIVDWECTPYTYTQYADSSLLHLPFSDCINRPYQGIDLSSLDCVSTLSDDHTMMKSPNDMFLKTCPALRRYMTIFLNTVKEAQ